MGFYFLEHTLQPISSQALHDHQTLQEPKCMNNSALEIMHATLILSTNKQKITMIAIINVSEICQNTKNDNVQ